ncbi:hypothetical protein LTSEMON_1849, partial [Salmonella enterica subsp. enterica serovar Montevideo str. S5-403]
HRPGQMVYGRRQGKVITVGDNVFIIPDSLQHYWLTAG